MLAEHCWQKDRLRLLVCGWIACSLETFFSLSVRARHEVLANIAKDNNQEKLEHGCIDNFSDIQKDEEKEKDKGKEYDFTDCIQVVKNIDGKKYPSIPVKAEEYIEYIRVPSKLMPIDEIEKRVFLVVSSLYERIDNLGLSGNGDYAILPNKQSCYMRDWLEQKLPLLLSPLYVPITSKENTKRWYDRVETYLGKKTKCGSKALLDYWGGNSDFILSQFNSDLDKLFADTNSSTNGKSKKKQPKPIKNPETLKIFGELHQFLERIKAKNEINGD